MTLRRKMSLQIGAMIVGLLRVCAASLWGVRGLRSNLRIASTGYRELREMYEVASHISAARTLLRLGERTLAATEIDRAHTKLEVALSRVQAGSVLKEAPDGLRLATEFRDSIKRAELQLKLPAGDESFHSDTESANESINQAFGAVTAIAIAIRRTIDEHEQAANVRWRQTITLMAIVSVTAVLASIALGILQYKSVIIPLHRLGEAARTMAGGKFNHRVASHGSTEFIELAKDFNGMANELETLYRELEQKVESKSKELVRSERLASVGYLAAGVAHEINNPLSVITGYGERAIQQLERGGATAQTINQLRIMCEEAYRCKTITDKLLTMARPGDEERKRISLCEVAKDVASLVEGLPSCKDRRLILELDDQIRVHGNGSELKQVLLNLTLNAMVAVTPKVGEVQITVNHRDGFAQITVSDNGVGMTPDTIERVFEPFFTKKRGSQSAGTGLGLAISHAIIENHGGRIQAFSDGLEKGSRFEIEWPLPGAMATPPSTVRM